MEEDLKLRREKLEALGWRFEHAILFERPVARAVDPNGDYHGQSYRLDFSYTLSVCPAIEQEENVE